jgi:uncharacterized membrane-anchored protein YhcB (DUF1043 family)
MRFQEQTKRHFGKSAELLGRMATDYREFLHHFVTGAEELCGPNLTELNASGLERPLLDGTAHAPAAAAASHAETTAPDDTAAAPQATLSALPTPLEHEPLAEDAAR